MPESRIDLVLSAASVPAEAAKIEQSFAGISKAAQSAGVSGAAGLTQIEVAAKLNRADLALLNTLYEQTAAKQGANSAAAGLLAQELRAQGVATEGAIAATQASTLALEQNAIAHAEVAAAAGLSTRQIVQVGAAVDRLAGVAIPGARSIGLLAGSFSAAAIPQLALIVGISLLIGKLVELARAKQEQLKLDQDALTTDALLFISSRTIAEAAIRQENVTRDINALLVQYREANEKLTVSQAAEDHALNRVLTARQNDTAAIKESAGAAQAFMTHTEDATRAEGEATQKRLEGSKVVRDSISQLIRFAAETAASKNAVIDAARQIGLESGALDQLKNALDSASFAALQFRLGQTALSNLQVKVAADAAALGHTFRNHAEATAELTRATRQLTPEQQQQIELTERTQKNLHNLTDATVRHTGAVRAYSNALVELRKRAADAEAGLSLDTLSLQQFKISAQIAAERQHLAINKRDKVEAMRILDQIERDMLAGTLRAAAEANKQAQEAARTQRLSHLKQIERMEQDHNKILLHQYMDLIQQELKSEETIAAARLRAANQAAEIGRTNIGAQAEAEVDRVAKAFGRASKDEQIFALQLQALDRFTQGDFLGGAITSLKAIGLEALKSGVIFQQLGQAVSHVFEGLVTGAESAKVVFLRFLAEILAFLGSMAIAAGTVFLFLPGFHGLGIGLIAAGVAALALAGVLQGVASNLSQSQHASTGGAATTSGAVTSTTARPGVPPQLISFPTSGALGGPMVIKLDGNQWDRLMKGEAVLTMPGLQGKDNRAVKRALKLV